MAREPEAVTAMRGTLSGSALFSSAANEGFRYLGDMSDVLLYIDELTTENARLREAFVKYTAYTAAITNSQPTPLAATARQDD